MNSSRKRRSSNQNDEGKHNCKRRRFAGFDVYNYHRFEKEFPSFREPLEIGHFSLNQNRQFHDDNHQLKYLIMPKNPKQVSLDLNKGIKEAIRKNFELTEKIDNLLHWILAHKNKFVSRSDSNTDIPESCASLNTDFICYRGLLTKILCTPYEERESWIICATKYNGTIYLCAFDTEEDKERNANRTERDIVMSSWGYKFEQYMVASEPDASPNVDDPVNENEEFCSLVRTRLNSHSLVFGAEMDGIDARYVRSHPEHASSMSRYVELKTSRIITAERQERNFCKYKLLKWWAQAFLVGIRKVICGFRDDEGIVRSIQVYDVLRLPKMSRNFWSPSVCMNFCDQFLTHLKECVTTDDPYIVYKFEFIPNQEIKCTELRNDSVYQILPEWYISSPSKQFCETSVTSN